MYPIVHHEINFDQRRGLVPFKGVLHFSNSDEHAMWMNEYRELKESLASYHGLPAPEFVYKVQYQWLPLCNKFISFWGAEMLPGDVRHAIHDAQFNLKLNMTSFPELPAYEDGDD